MIEKINKGFQDTSMTMTHKPTKFGTAFGSDGS
jgi:hypothetical protein